VSYSLNLESSEVVILFKEELMMTRGTNYFVKDTS